MSGAHNHEYRILYKIVQYMQSQSGSCICGVFVLLLLLLLKRFDYLMLGGGHNDGNFIKNRMGRIG